MFNSTMGPPPLGDHLPKHLGYSQIMEFTQILIHHSAPTLSLINTLTTDLPVNKPLINFVLKT